MDRGNPFHALANGIVPAILLFCVALGVALMDMRGKEGGIAGLAVLNKAVSHVTQFVTRLFEPPPQFDKSAAEMICAAERPEGSRTQRVRDESIKR